MRIWIDNAEQGIVYLFLALFIGVLGDMLLKKLIDKEHIPKTALISVFIVFMYIGIYGYSVKTLWCVMLCQVLLMASVWDIATHTVPDCFHIFIMMIGLIGFDPSKSFIGMVVVALPFFISAMISAKGMGGGDVKLMGAIGFTVGLKLGITILVVGLFFAIIFEQYFKITKNKSTNEPFALVPYLGIGCGMALLSF